MNKWMVHVFGDFSFNAVVKARQDVNAIGREIGYGPLYTWIEWNRGQEEDITRASILGIITRVGPGDLVVMQHPTGPGYWFQSFFVEELHKRHAHLILFLQDAVELREGEKAHGYDFSEINFFNQADVVIAHSPQMIDWLREKGVTTTILDRVMHDCLLNEEDAEYSEKLTRQIVFVGSGYKSPFLSQWGNQTELLAFFDKIDHPLDNHVRGGGVYPFEELVRHLPRDCFGILWDSDLEGSYGFQNYTRYSAPHKIGLYLSLGLPVLVWEGTAVADVIKKYGLGFALSSLNEIDPLMKSLTDEDLKKLKHRVNKFSQALREGFFTRRVLVEAEKALVLKSMNEK